MLIATHMYTFSLYNMILSWWDRKLTNNVETERDYFINESMTYLSLPQKTFIWVQMVIDRVWHLEFLAQQQSAECPDGSATLHAC